MAIVFPYGSKRSRADDTGRCGAYKGRFSPAKRIDKITHCQVAAGGPIGKGRKYRFAECHVYRSIIIGYCGCGDYGQHFLIGIDCIITLGGTGCSSVSVKNSVLNGNYSDHFTAVWRARKPQAQGIVIATAYGYTGGGGTG